MCEFISGIVTKNGDVYLSENYYSHSHSDIMKQHGLTDDNDICANIARFEFIPYLQNAKCKSSEKITSFEDLLVSFGHDTTKYDLSSENWYFKLDEYRTPIWWDEEFYKPIIMKKVITWINQFIKIVPRTPQINLRLEDKTPKFIFIDGKNKSRHRTSSIIILNTLNKYDRVYLSLSNFKRVEVRKCGQTLDKCDITLNKVDSAKVCNFNSVSVSTPNTYIGVPISYLAVIGCSNPTIYNIDKLIIRGGEGISSIVGTSSINNCNHVIVDSDWQHSSMSLHNVEDITIRVSRYSMNKIKVGCDKHHNPTKINIENAHINTIIHDINSSYTDSGRNSCILLIPLGGYNTERCYNLENIVLSKLSTVIDDQDNEVIVGPFARKDNKTYE